MLGEVGNNEPVTILSNPDVFGGILTTKLQGRGPHVCKDDESMFQGKYCDSNHNLKIYSGERRQGRNS